MENLWKVAIGFIAIIGFSEQITHAQSPPFDPAFDVQLFDRSIGPSSFISINDGTTARKSQYTLELLLTFLTDPFLISNFDETRGEISGPRNEVVSSVFAGQLVGAYGITDRLQLGASLPIAFSISGNGLDPSTGRMSTSGDLQSTGFGDLRIEAKIKLLETDTLGAAGYGGFTAPTSVGTGGGDYLGDNLPSMRGGAAIHMSSGPVTLAANLGVVLRKTRTIYAIELGSQVMYGAGIALAVTDRFSTIGELSGRSDLTDLNVNASPLEGNGGIRAQVTDNVTVTAGGGTGIVGGIGSPDLRVVFSVGYSPDMGDTDGDGIPNTNDRCPLQPEDIDKFEDSDGCPDDDNDGDHRNDTVDECPNDKEDIDGFDDEDGCPEPDNDNDNILDLDDRCPLDAEDGIAPHANDGCPRSKRDSDGDGVSDLMDQCSDAGEDNDNFEDWDGCPEPDNDNDGIPDENDACPLCPEDIDGFDDEDGCPDPDNDHDGIPDSSDQCPNAAEVFNGYRDRDGCSDRGNSIAKLEGNRLFLSTKVRFNARNVVRDKKDVRLIAKVLKLHPEIAKWRVVVAIPKKGSEAKTRRKSQAQANSIRDTLVSGGINIEQIEAIGAVAETQTVAIVATERVPPEQPGALCPESMQVRPQLKPEKIVPNVKP